MNSNSSDSNELHQNQTEQTEINSGISCPGRSIEQLTSSA